MKKTGFFLCILLITLGSYAQCDKNVVLTSSKTEYLDSAMAVQHTDNEQSTIELSDSQIVIVPGNADRKMIGEILSKTCNWTIPFKEGKSIIKTMITDEQGEKNLTVTIEGKDGKVTLLAEIAEMPDRKIRVPVDTFEEKK